MGIEINLGPTQSRSTTTSKQKLSKMISVLHVNKSYRQPTIWEQLVYESDTFRSHVEDYKKLVADECEVPLTPPVQYMQNKVLLLLARVLEETLFKAVETESLLGYRSTFNGLDYIAELLWNRNPMHPSRFHKHIYIHDMRWVKMFLAKNPRPYFPLSWIYTKEIAAIIIQRTFRAYLVRRREDVQEMRIFWKVIRQEARASREAREARGSWGSRKLSYPKSVQIDLPAGFQEDPYKNKDI